MFYTSLFTVNKMLSMEAREFFYVKNSFVIVQGCFIDTIQLVGRQVPIVTLGGAPDSVEAFLGRKVAMTISMADRIVTIPEWPFGNFNLVIAARHLSLFLTILKYDATWDPVGDAMDSLHLKFTFNMKSGEYNHSRNLNTTSRIRNSAKCLRGLLTLASLCGVIVFQIDGDLEQTQANELLQSLKLPLTGASVLDDFQLLHQKANETRDVGAYDAAQSLYSQIISSYQEIRLNNRLHSNPVRLPDEFLESEFDLFAVGARMNMGICSQKLGRFKDAKGSFEWAIRTYEKKGRCVPEFGNTILFMGKRSWIISIPTQTDSRWLLVPLK